MNDHVMFPIDILDSDSFQDLTYSAVKCYLAILRDDGRWCRPSLTDIAKWSRIHRGSVIRGMEELESAGLITRVPGQRGQTTSYRVIAGAVGETSDIL